MEMHCITEEIFLSTIMQKVPVVYIVRGHSTLWNSKPILGKCYTITQRSRYMKLFAVRPPLNSACEGLVTLLLNVVNFK